MAPASSQTLRRPAKPGFMAPYVVLEMGRAVHDTRGQEDLDKVMKEAQLFRLPEVDEPVREDKVARLHQAVRKLWPQQATEIGRKAGAEVAERIIESQITEKAQSMLSRMPRATGAWLLAKTLRRNDWIFSGTGEFVVETETRFLLRDNPLVAGETAQAPVCHFHASLFETLFAALIHPRLVCSEIACQARGDAACVFEFTLAQPE